MSAVAGSGERRYLVDIRGRTLLVELLGDGVRIEGAFVDADLSPPAGPSRSLTIGTSSHRLVVRRGEGGGRWDLHLGGLRFEVRVGEEGARSSGGSAGPSSTMRAGAPLRAPMPGLVVRVDVQVGDDVVTGQGLVVVEAMKMENELRAETDGRVASVEVSAGDAVEKDDMLVGFEQPEEGG